MRGGARVGSGRPIGSGAGKTVTTKSVSMTPRDWAIINAKRGMSSRGVYLSACLHRRINAKRQRLRAVGLKHIV